MNLQVPSTVRKAFWLVLLPCFFFLSFSGVLVSGKVEQETLPEVLDRPSLELTATRLEAGDLLFRRGRSLHSHAVLLTDPASRFSHVGLVVKGLEGLFVAHSVPAEGEQDGGVRLDPLEHFLSPETAVDWAAMRLARGLSKS